VGAAFVYPTRKELIVKARTGKTPRRLDRAESPVAIGGGGRLGRRAPHGGEGRLPQ
jgi:hypothetical protein